MSLNNTSRGYGWLSIGLHWIVAAGVIVMFAIGLRAGALGEAGDRAGRSEAMGWHIAIGSVLVLLILPRLIAHYTQRQPEPLAQHKALNALASITHHLLLVALLIMIVSGPLAVWSGGRPLNFAGVLPIPSPFAERNQAVHELAEQLHLVGRVALFFLIPIHVIGALKHIFTARTFRMLKPES